MVPNLSPEEQARVPDMPPGWWERVVAELAANLSGGALRVVTDPGMPKAWKVVTPEGRVVGHGIST